MAKSRYRVAQVGLGARGKVHANAFLESDRFEVVGLCELREEQLRAYIDEKSLSADLAYGDAEAMLEATRPDIFCFVTQPNVSRLAFVELAAKYGVSAIAFEKPMSTSLTDARGIVGLCRAHGIKGVVCHQHKYLTSLEGMKAAVDTGRIGNVQLITASCQAWLAQLGTHYVDYTLWVNDFCDVEWVVGHVHGKELLSNHHPSPNYVMGQIGFANGVRAFVEFGRLSASHVTTGSFWVDDRLTVYGSLGNVWGEADGRWGGLIDGKPFEEQGGNFGEQARVRLQEMYVAELADWLDGTIADHSCSVEHAYQGYEVMEALCLSAMDNVRVDLPLQDKPREDMFERMRRELPDCPEREQQG